MSRALCGARTPNRSPNRFRPRILFACLALPAAQGGCIVHEIKEQPAAEEFFRGRGFGHRVGWGKHPALLTGCTTSGCVRATAVDAMQHGFRPIVVREAAGDG